jgi:hypothetical protein
MTITDTITVIRITGTTTTQTADSGATALWDATFYVLIVIIMFTNV